MSQNLSGNLSGQIADMLEGSIAGSISLVSPSANIESKTITENGTYTAPSGVDGYNPITVNVPSQQPVIESKSITENGTYNVPSGVDGFNPVVVNVPAPQPVIEPKTITENGTYAAPSGVNGYSPITVSVPSSVSKIVSNVNKFKLGVAIVDGYEELVFTCTDAYIDSVEALSYFSNSRIVEGIDTNTLKLCKAYDSAEQSNQIGWVGFYQNSLRAWNVDLSNNILLEHVYCSLLLSDATSQQDNPYIEL